VPDTGEMVPVPFPLSDAAMISLTADLGKCRRQMPIFGT